jgi:predicted regulator of Ras-like GTPase activity (Roadblock/LC7/MglB family)
MDPRFAKLLRQGMEAARRGNKAKARELLLQATEVDPTSEEAWLWLAGVAESSEDTELYLQTVLALNPDNLKAQQGLRWLQSQGSGESTPQPTLEPDTFEPQDLSAAEAMPSIPPPPEISPGFVLSAEQAERIDKTLERMAYDSEASCIILADMTGQLISEWGQLTKINTQVLSALAAGELAATHEMARLVGEKARFKLLLHEGEEHSVYLSDVGEELILVIVFKVDTPIGLVRMILKQAVDELAPIIEEADRTEDSAQVNEALGSDFAQLLEDELDTSLDLGS